MSKLTPDQLDAKLNSVSDKDIKEALNGATSVNATTSKDIMVLAGIVDETMHFSTIDASVRRIGVLPKKTRTKRQDLMIDTNTDTAKLRRYESILSSMSDEFKAEFNKKLREAAENDMEAELQKELEAVKAKFNKRIASVETI